MIAELVIHLSRFQQIALFAVAGLCIVALYVVDRQRPRR